MAAMLMPLLLGSAISYAKTRKEEEEAAADAKRREREMQVFQSLMGGAPSAPAAAPSAPPSGMPAVGPMPAPMGPVPGGTPPGPAPAPAQGVNVMGDVLARHPYMLAQAEAISNIADPDERQRAWITFYNKNSELLKSAADEQKKSVDIDTWTNTMQNMDISKISDPYLQGVAKNTQDLLAAGVDPGTLYDKYPDKLKKAFEQSGGAIGREDQQVHDAGMQEDAQQHEKEVKEQELINAKVKEQFKNDLSRTTFNYERTATAHDEMNKKLPAVLQTYRELQTALKDIGVGELGTGLIERWQEIPRASKENLQRLSIILGRKALKEDWGESRPTDKDADMAISIQPNPRLSEEQNQRLIMAALYNYDYMLEYHRERGMYLDQFEAQTPDTFYFKGTPPPEEVPGFEDAGTDGEGEVMEYDDFLKQYGNLGQ